MFGPQKRVGAENSIAADHQGKRDSLKELAELKPRAKVRVPSGGAVDRHQNTWDRNAPIASVSYPTSGPGAITHSATRFLAASSGPGFRSPNRDLPRHATLVACRNRNEKSRSGNSATTSPGSSGRLPRARVCG